MNTTTASAKTTVRFDISEDELKDKLVEDRKWLFRAILALYNRQTEEEQTIGVTVSKNHQGFNAAHGKVGKIHGEMIANHYIKGFSLSYKQVQWIEKFWTKSSKRTTPRIWIYTKQLMVIIKEKQKMMNG
jgi:hypothetical protein